MLWVHLNDASFRNIIGVDEPSENETLGCFLFGSTGSFVSVELHASDQRCSLVVRGGIANQLRLLRVFSITRTFHRWVLGRFVQNP